MEHSEEKFFESLAAFGKRETNSGSEPTAELVKEKSGLAGRTKLSVRRENDEFEDDGPEGQLTIDVYQTEHEIVVESAVAGVHPDNLDIDVSSDSVTIKGKRAREKEVRDEDYLYQECYWGRFSRSIILPQEIDPDKATVNFKNGILTVHLPKLSRQRAKKLRVKID